MKLYFKSLLVKILWFLVSALRQKHNPIVIAVAGSVGKTSTKSAIATVLSEKYNVQWQNGNYNDIVSVPLIFFGQKMPNIYNPFGWLKLFMSAVIQILGSYKYNIVIIELGSDKPGDIGFFKKYLHVDYGILTAISAEHMENFNDIEAVAKEELGISEIADVLIVDIDSVDKKYLKSLKNIMTIGEGSEDCRITSRNLTPELKRPVKFSLKTGKSIELETEILGKQGLPAMAVATLLSSELELTDQQIKCGLNSIKPFAGRMQPLSGLKGSLIIDDTYNASPKAVETALMTLYEIPAKNKIAILGQMNELGKHSKALHQEIGRSCDPKQLKLVVTIGKDANKYLASEAERRGCKVVRCPSPYHASDVVRPLLRKDTVILAKGSQNGVFAEEAIKELLYNPEDVNKLVRQSNSWLKIKDSQFSRSI